MTCNPPSKSLDASNLHYLNDSQERNAMCLAHIDFKKEKKSLAISI